MKAEDIMTLNVISVAPDSSIVDAANVMLREQISGLPVINSVGGLVGIITEGDFLRRQETATQRHRNRWIEFLIGPGKLAEEYVHNASRKVKEVMTSRVHTVLEDTPLEDVVRLMERNHIKRVPVMRGTRVVGMLSRANLMRAVVKLSLDAEPVSSGDKQIKETLLTNVKKQPWAPTALIDISVKDGVVKISGAVTDDRERDALRVAAENIQGVKQVVDDLVYFEPMTGMVA